MNDDDFNLSNLGDDVLARLEQYDEEIADQGYTSPDSDIFIIRTLEGVIDSEYDY